MQLFLRSCTKLEYLGLGSCTSINNYDDIAAEIARNLKNLKSLDLWRAKTLTSVGIYLLANHCFLLHEIDIGWCNSIDASSGCLRDLFHKCSELKRVILATIRSVSDFDLITIANHLKHVEQLDLLGVREITKEGILKILTDCKNLKLLDVSFCSQIDFEIVGHWQDMFPNITIQKSYQVPD